MEITITGKKVLVDEDVAATLKDYWCYISGMGYVITQHKKTKVRVALHRLVAGAGKKDGNHVDHKNRDKLDNRRENLRIATISQNAMNRPSRNGKDRNVYWCTFTKKWVVQISKDCKRYNLGRFTDKDEARRVAEAARKEMHGEFRFSPLPA